MLVKSQKTKIIFLRKILFIIIISSIIVPIIYAQPAGIEVIDFRKRIIHTLKGSYEVFGIEFTLQVSSFKSPYQIGECFYAFCGEKLPMNFTLSIIKAPLNASLYVKSIWVSIPGLNDQIDFIVNKTFTKTTIINLNSSILISPKFRSPKPGGIERYQFNVGIAGKAVYGKNVKEFHSGIWGRALISGYLDVKASDLPLIIDIIDVTYTEKNDSLIIQLKLVNRMQQDIVNVKISHDVGDWASYNAWGVLFPSKPFMFWKEIELGTIEANKERNFTIQFLPYEWIEPVRGSRISSTGWIKVSYLTPEGEAVNYLGFILNREKIAKKVESITTISRMNITHIIKEVENISKYFTNINVFPAIIIFFIGLLLLFIPYVRFLGVFLISFAFYMLGLPLLSFFTFPIGLVLLAFSLRRYIKKPQKPLEIHRVKPHPSPILQISREKLMGKKTLTLSIPPQIPSLSKEMLVKKIEEKPILDEKLSKALERAEEYLALGNIKRCINICFLFIYKTLKLLSKKEKASIEEIVKDLRLKGYSIDSNELLKIKGIFIRARKGEAISEDEAKFCLKFAKHIKSFFKEIKREERFEYDIIIDGMNVMMAGEKIGKVAKLEKVLDILEGAGLRTCTICDASVKHKEFYLIFEKKYEKWMNKKIFICPAGTSADALIIPLARDNKALILSNDSFKEWESKYPDLPKHLVKFSFIGDRLYFYPNPRSPELAEAPDKAINSLREKLNALRGNK